MAKKNTRISCAEAASMLGCSTEDFFAIAGQNHIRPFISEDLALSYDMREIMYLKGGLE